MISKKSWKKFWRSVLLNPINQWVIVLVLSGVVWAIFWSSKHKFTNMEVLNKCKDQPVIFAFFHGRSIMLSPVIKRSGVRSYCITSQHRDGRMMAKLQRLFGLKPIYGSSSKGGLSVLRESVHVIKDKKESICISVDGPSGPSMRIKDGALYFARITGAPIVPCCYTSSRGIFLNRWDRFFIPGLFGTLSVNVGDPIYLDPKLSGEALEQKRAEIELKMEKQLRDLDGEFHKFRVEKDLTATEFKKHKH